MGQLHTSSVQKPILLAPSLFPVMDWGLIDYQESNNKQQDLVAKIHQESTPGVLVYCKHQPLVTVGRATKENDVHSWAGQILKTPRGGRATYHGPNQLVIYPIINLNYSNYKVFKKRDITTYLRLLEKVVIETLQEFNIAAYQRCEKIDHNGEKLEATGVWVKDKKIASIGVAVRRWVSYHGIAINVFKDEQAFKGINPCGFESNIMTSIEHETAVAIDLNHLKSTFCDKFNKYFH